MIPILIVYGVMSLVTFVLFGIDKRAAIRGQWRIPEATLHFCELLGGWPGALAAQRVFHHKSRKVSYRLVLWAIIVAHLVCGFFLWREFG